MNAVWENLWQECIHDYRECINPLSGVSEIVDLG